MSLAVSEATSLIDVRDLTRRLGGKLVRNGFNLNVERGETCVIFGVSGSSKSTFAHLLACSPARLLVGSERADAGEIRVDELNIVGLDECEDERVRWKFASAFQNSALLESMSVFENVAFPQRETRQMGAAEIGRRVHHALIELNAEDAAKKLPGELSAEMVERVGIARAFVTEPAILAYDEPTSDNDPVDSRIVDELIVRMCKRYCVTSTVITHDMVTATDIPDCVIPLANGKAVAHGPPEEQFGSHGKDIEPFTRESGIDLAGLLPRTSRKSPAKILAQWKAAHQPIVTPPRVWWRPRSWRTTLLRFLWIACYQHHEFRKVHLNSTE